MLFLAVTAGIVVGYVATVHAEMIIHRDIFHGRWAIVHRGPFKWLLYPHYVQHWKGHHTHAARHRDDLERGDRVPDSAHKVVETKYDNQWNVQYGLRCTDHGITIKGAECFTHYLLLFLLTPQPYLAGLLWFVLGPIAGIPAAIMPLATAVLHRNHRYFHMSIEARRKRTVVAALVCTVRRLHPGRGRTSQAPLRFPFLQRLLRPSAVRKSHTQAIGEDVPVQRHF